MIQNDPKRSKTINDDLCEVPTCSAVLTFFERKQTNEQLEANYIKGLLNGA